MSGASAPVKGARPEGASSEADASRKVRDMFTQIAPRYDLLNHLLSFELDRLWRARAAKCLRPILKRPDAVDRICVAEPAISLWLSETPAKPASSARILRTPCLSAP